MLGSTTRMPELSQLTTKLHVWGLRPRNITPTLGDLETTVTKVLATEQVKRCIFKTKLSFHEVQKNQIMLTVLNLDKSSVCSVC